jgi:hypothetical protein
MMRLTILYSISNTILYLICTLNCANRWIQQSDGLYPL